MASTRLADKADSEERSLRLAVLIDADNAQATVIEGLLAEIARFGEATVKRIYGDFTAQASSSWKKVLQRYAIKPVQQFAYTTGKNATDSTLIIDAMDLLYTRKFDGFCLVTSVGIQNRENMSSLHRFKRRVICIGTAPAVDLRRK